MSFNKYLVLLFIIIGSFTDKNLLAQDLEIGIWAGVGSYQMEELQAIQDQLLDEIGIEDLQATESFPIYYNFGLNYDYSNYGIFFRYESTGARIAYSDYSGAFFYDQTAANYLIGGSARFYYNNNIQKRLAPFLVVKSGASLTNVEFTQTLTIDSETTSDNLSLAETSFFVEPGVGIRWKYKSILIDPTLSIYIPVLREGLHLEGNKDAKLQNSDGDMHANWLGFRAGINISFTI